MIRHIVNKVLAMLSQRDGGKPVHVETGEGVIRCSFCSATQYEVRKLVAGPELLICDRCVVKAAARVATGGPVQRMPEIQHATALDVESCDFCGKRIGEARLLAYRGSARICDECLCLCIEICSGDKPSENAKAFPF